MRIVYKQKNYVQYKNKKTKNKKKHDESGLLENDRKGCGNRIHTTLPRSYTVEREIEQQRDGELGPKGCFGWDGGAGNLFFKVRDTTACLHADWNLTDGES